MSDREGVAIAQSGVGEDRDDPEARMTCPDCNGAGAHTAIGIACGSVGCESGIRSFRCSTCIGTGVVPDVMASWRAEGAAIKAIREECDLSQRELARHIGVSPRDLNEAEHGRIDPARVLASARAWRGLAAHLLQQIAREG